jgi:hypothetical protein
VPAAIVKRRGERGFALLLVLWVMVLLSGIALHLLASGRTEMALARNGLEAAKAEALADAAIVSALYNFLGQRPSWVADGKPRLLSFPEGSAVVEVSDENAKINPNLAAQGLIASLFETLGASSTAARAAAAAIVGERLARLALAPLPGAVAFVTVDDLDAIAEARTWLAVARPYLSVYADRSEPALERAADVVRRAVINRTDGGHREPVSEGSAAARAIRPVIRLRGHATTAAGSQFVREAIVRLDRERPAGYATMLWRRVIAER